MTLFARVRPSEGVLLPLCPFEPIGLCRLAPIFYQTVVRLPNVKG